MESEALRGNPLGDPHERPLWVWTPPGYDDEPERRYPSVYVIQGYTGQLDMWRNRSAFRPKYPELLDETRPTASSSSSTRGRRSAARSSSTRRRQGGTTRISATSSCPGWTRASGRSGAVHAVGEVEGGYGARHGHPPAGSLRGSPATPAAVSSRYDPAVLPRGGPNAERPLRRLRRALPRRAPRGAGVPPPERRPHPAPVGLRGRVFGRDGTIRLPYDARRPRWFPSSGSAGSSGTSRRSYRGSGRAARAARDLFDCGARDEWFVDLTVEWLRRGLTALGVTATSRSSSSTRRTPRSNIAIRSGSPTSSSASPRR